MRKNSGFSGIFSPFFCLRIEEKKSQYWIWEWINDAISWSESSLVRMGAKEDDEPARLVVENEENFATFCPLISPSQIYPNALTPSNTRSKKKKWRGKKILLKITRRKVVNELKLYTTREMITITIWRKLEFSFLFLPWADTRICEAEMLQMNIEWIWKLSHEKKSFQFPSSPSTS